MRVKESASQNCTYRNVYDLVYGDDLKGRSAHYLPSFLWHYRCLPGYRNPKCARKVDVSIPNGPTKWWFWSSMGGHKRQVSGAQRRNHEKFMLFVAFCASFSLDELGRELMSPQADQNSNSFICLSTATGNRKQIQIQGFISKGSHSSPNKQILKPTKNLNEYL